MITLGLVDSVDDNGVYVTMPGSKGVLRGPYKSLSTVAAGTTVLVASTDDGEQVVVGTADGGDGLFNVKTFGAKGDAVTDDTAAIQAAIDAAAACDGGTVFLPPGRYALTEALEMRPRVSMRGVVAGKEYYWGQGAQLLPQTPGQTTIRFFAEAWLDMIEDVELSDFSIVGADVADGCLGIVMEGDADESNGSIDGVTFTRLRFANLDVAVWGRALDTLRGWNNSGVKISQCTTNVVNTGIRVESQNCDFWHIDTCILRFLDTGLHLEPAGYVLMTATAGGGYDSNPDSTFILASNTGPLTVVSSQAEGMDHFFRTASGAPAHDNPYTFVGCLADAPYTIGASIGLNLFGCASTTDTDAIVDTSAASRIVTIGGESRSITLGTNSSLVEFDGASSHLSGTGSPEGAIPGNIGSIYRRLDGGAGTTLYVKESSPTPTTGWVAK